VKEPCDDHFRLFEILKYIQSNSPPSAIYPYADRFYCERFSIDNQFHYVNVISLIV
jgi:hypothetical protein